MMEVRFLEEGREWRLPGFLYADDLVRDMTAIEGHFVEVCRRRGLTVNGDKCKVMVLHREEGLEC